VFVSIGVVIGALVVFGKNLADLILKWKDVLSVLNSKKLTTESTITKSNKNGENHSIIRGDRFEALAKSENNGNIQRFRLRNVGRELAYREVLQLWEKDQEFLDFYISIFKKCEFNSYIWEAPPISTDAANQPFEFVLLNTPIASKRPDRETYEEYYDLNTPNHGVVSFPNLGRDAVLVVPSPFRKDANYSGLAEFFREAPIDQQRALWMVTAHQLQLQLSEKPTWVSVAGGGIAWLHIRLDSIPKYYRYMPYTNWKAPNKTINYAPSAPDAL